MIREVVQISPQNSISEAAKIMREKAVGCLVITVDGAIKGIITDRDLLGCIEWGHDPRVCQISAHMSRPVVVLKPEEDDMTAVEIIRRRRIKRLPVAKGGKLLGIVSLSDFARIAALELAQLESSVGRISSFVTALGIKPRVTKAPEKAPDVQGPIGKKSAFKINEKSQLASL
jgi:CBS domain-containing protein